MASWIFFGLAWLALVINHTIDILERLNGHFKQKCCCGKKQEEELEEEETGSVETSSPETQVEEVQENRKPTLTE